MLSQIISIFGNITVFGFPIPPSMIITLAVLLWMLARIAQARRKSAAGARIGATFGAGLLKPLPGDVGLLAAIGEGGRVRETLGTLTLGTTPGLRLVWLAVSLLLIYVSQTTPGLWEFKPTAFPAEPATNGPFQLSMFGLIVSLTASGLSALGVFGFEARMDKDTLYICKYFYINRQYAWNDLISIKDNGQYDYVLRFKGGKSTKVTKYLVGMPQLLKFMGGVLEQNEAVNARTARS